MTDIHKIIERVEAKYFRTHQDTGAHFNALIVWNALRQEAGLPDLTRDDLRARARDSYLTALGKACVAGDQGLINIYKRAVTDLDVEADAE